MAHGAKRLLAACDYVGEKVAAALGITSPKYKYEIEQFKKIEKEREKVKEEEKTVGGWMQQTHDNNLKGSQMLNEANAIAVISRENIEKF